jgi:hypothetical protein
MTASPDDSIVSLAFYGACEAILGLLVGWSLHIGVEKIEARLRLARIRHSPAPEQACEIKNQSSEARDRET